VNEIHIEGAVTRTWRFQEAQFARIACRLDSGRVQMSEAGQRESEYITLRFEPPLARPASTLRNGVVVRATGYLASREYDITLTSFKSAKGGDEALEQLRKPAEEQELGDEVRKPHVLNEVVVERFEVLEE